MSSSLIEDAPIESLALNLLGSSSSPLASLQPSRGASAKLLFPLDPNFGELSTSMMLDPIPRDLVEDEMEVSRDMVIAPRSVSSMHGSSSFADSLMHPRRRSLSCPTRVMDIEPIESAENKVVRLSSCPPSTSSFDLRSAEDGEKMDVDTGHPSRLLDLGFRTPSPHNQQDFDSSSLTLTPSSSRITKFGSDILSEWGHFPSINNRKRAREDDDEDDEDEEEDESEEATLHVNNRNQKKRGLKIIIHKSNVDSQEHPDEGRSHQDEEQTSQVTRRSSRLKIKDRVQYPRKIAAEKPRSPTKRVRVEKMEKIEEDPTPMFNDSGGARSKSPAAKQTVSK